MALTPPGTGSTRPCPVIEQTTHIPVVGSDPVPDSPSEKTSLMPTSPFPGMDPFLEKNPQWEVFHGWFIRELARLAIAPARDAGCSIDVERSIYGRDTSGQLVMYGEPDVLLIQDELPANSRLTGGTALAMAKPQAVHEVTLADDGVETHKQEYIVVRVDGTRAPVLAIVELLSFANKTGTYARKYREKRDRCLASGTHFMEIDFLRAGKNPSRNLFSELPPTAYFVYVARKNGFARIDEGYPLKLQDPLPIIGLPLGQGRPDLPMDFASAFRSAYDLGYRSNWLHYGKPVPSPPLSEADRTWVEEIIN